MKELARKITGLLHFMQNIICKRDHYDFGLPSFVIPLVEAAGVLTPAVLKKPNLSAVRVERFCLQACGWMHNAAGALRRREASTAEDVLLYRTLMDLIQPALVPADLPMFATALADVFPGTQAQAASTTPLRAAIEAELLETGLQVS